MHVPIQVDYGIRALIDLTEHLDEKPVRASDIARRKMIPEPYLARLLLSLQKGGIVISQRGPQGGHSLAKEPSEISMAMVMDRLGGNQTLVGCFDHGGYCGQVGVCPQRGVWQDVEEAMRSVLNATTIADLVERPRRAGTPADVGV